MPTNYEYPNTGRTFGDGNTFGGNDPGREPEPTDAELLRDFEAADVRLSNACENCMDFSEEGEPTDPEYLDAEYEWKLCNERREARGREYLSGARTMPDTPDEVAQLRAEVARLKDALIDRETECNQLHAEMQEPLTAQRLREHNDGYLYLGNGVEVAISGTTARIADLERDLKTAAGDYPVEMPEPGTPMAILLSANVLLKRENAALGVRLSVIEKWALTTEDDSFPGEWEHGYEAARNWVAMHFKSAVSPGKEPTDA